MFVAKGFVILGGGKNPDIPGVFAAKVVSGAGVAQVLPLILI